MTDARHAKRIRLATGALLEGRGRWRQELVLTGLVRGGQNTGMEAKEERGEERGGKRREEERRKTELGQRETAKIDPRTCRKSETMAGWGAQKESKW